jgi:hypothetical protein
MKKMILFAVILGLFCAKKENDYYPLFVGSIKVFEVERITITGKDTTQHTFKQGTRVLDKKYDEYWGDIWKVATQEPKRRPTIAYIKKTKTEIKLIPNPQDTSTEVKQFNLPLQIGSKWIVARASNDTIFGQVIGLEKVKVPVGEFDSCYQVEITETKNPEFYRKVWLAPNIGIIKNEIKSVTTQDKKEKTIFEKSVLIQYNLKPEKTSKK